MSTVSFCNSHSKQCASQEGELPCTEFFVWGFYRARGGSMTIMNPLGHFFGQASFPYRNSARHLKSAPQTIQAILQARDRSPHCPPARSPQGHPGLFARPQNMRTHWYPETAHIICYKNREKSFPRAIQMIDHPLMYLVVLLVIQYWSCRCVRHCIVNPLRTAYIPLFYMRRYQVIYMNLIVSISSPNFCIYQTIIEIFGGFSVVISHYPMSYRTISHWNGTTETKI